MTSHTALRRRVATALAVVGLGAPLVACHGGSGGLGTGLPEGWPSGVAAALSPEQREEIAGDPELLDLPAPLAAAVVGEVTRPGNPEAAVARLVAAEAAIHDDATRPPVLRAAGHLQQVTYRVLGRRPGWDERVRELLPARLRGRFAANVRSRREFRELHGGRLSDTLPAWRIIEPLPAERLRSIYRAAERRFGVEWEYLAAINLIETGMGRIRGTSVAGAQGPMQFIPSTWDTYGRGDINDPRDAIMAAARYLDARGFNDKRRQGRGAVLLQQQRPLRARRPPARRADEAAAPDLPGLLPLGDLLPHQPRRRAAPGRLRGAGARPRAPIPRGEPAPVTARAVRSSVRRSARVGHA